MNLGSVASRLRPRLWLRFPGEKPARLTCATLSDTSFYSRESNANNEIDNALQRNQWSWRQQTCRLNVISSTPPSPQQQPSKMNLGIFPNVRPHFTSEKTSGHDNTFPS